VLLAVGGMALLGEWAATEAAGAPSRTLGRARAGANASARAGAPAAPAPPPRLAAPPSTHAAAAPSTPHYAATGSHTSRGSATDARTTAAHGAKGRPRYYIEDGRKAIALTIDDGPNPVYTPQVLRLLDRYGVTAAFSMVGANVAAYPSLARDVANAGHMIVNHTWTHADLAVLAPAAIRDQISRASDAIHHATGRRPGMFRAPYGAWSPAVLKRCEQMGLTPLDWSVDPRDWVRPGVGAIVTDIMRSTCTGSIILEHDGGGDRSETVSALAIVLPQLLAAGFRFRSP
jgi:peptidoglycan/xylan/chitin deacetylase (PgdA/CDA1 family)